ncbi:MAG: hypothetical protein IT165_25115 [Bryobacterales bacterium]|nr:hypothetical protein [Bryobacterales bacterium]
MLNGMFGGDLAREVTVVRMRHVGARSKPKIWLTSTEANSSFALDPSHVTDFESADVVHVQIDRQQVAASISGRSQRGSVASRTGNRGA